MNIFIVKKLNTEKTDGQSALALEYGVSQPTVNQWLQRVEEWMLNIFPPLSKQQKAK